MKEDNDFIKEIAMGTEDEQKYVEDILMGEASFKDSFEQPKQSVIKPVQKDLDRTVCY